MGLLIAYGSLQRVDEFLASNTWHDTRTLLKGSSSSTSSRTDANSLSEKGDDDLAVKLDSVSAGWASEGELVIKEATLEVPLRGLTVIAGPSGSGKSTLLRVMLGDINPATGTISVRSRHTGFCDQTPWIANVSIRENVIGAFSFDKAHYYFALKTCALDRDLQDLAEGDEHVCGFNGASLSGGQRVRLVRHSSSRPRWMRLEANRVHPTAFANKAQALARAIYSKVDFLVLDDCLVGLDTATERQVLDNLFGPEGIVNNSIMACVLATSSREYARMRIFPTALTYVQRSTLGWPTISSPSTARATSVSNVANQTACLQSLIRTMSRWRIA
jgi:ABC-type bacteriocin/lantibiotic exporter with double-glycine peptidase domain